MTAYLTRASVQRVTLAPRMRLIGFGGWSALAAMRRHQARLADRQQRFAA